jgi:hypothetical protein
MNHHGRLYSLQWEFEPRIGAAAIEPKVPAARACFAIAYYGCYENLDTAELALKYGWPQRERQSLEPDQGDLWPCANTHRRAPSSSTARCVDYQLAESAQPIGMLAENVSSKPGEGEYLAAVRMT